MNSASPVQEFLGMPAVIRSECMVRLFGVARRIAQTSAAVLITGESGTGKELVARAVHHYSLRCAKQWVDVNCASLPETLIESELFGYEKGAFSGAEGAKQGLFEVANGGTLFLDEIGELEARTQVKLLRVLDGASYYRLGGVRKITVDVRVIAATNRDLNREIGNGGFRSDLFHRLSQVRLHVPPLRERPEDAIAIAEYYLGKLDPRLRLSAEAVRFICGYSWPGNIREVRNLITNAALMADGPEVTREHLNPTEAEVWSEDWNLDSLERKTIQQALTATRGHQNRAAELLGISQRTLNRKLKRYRFQSLAESRTAGAMA